MKVVLFDIESHFSAAAMEEAMDLVKETNEYDLTQPEEGFYHFLSRQPDYHVEMAFKADGSVVAKCHCTIFKRAKQCKHALAALLMLRDHILRTRRAKSKSKHENLLLDDVLKKMSVTELRHFISTHAQSHSAFRAEILANYLHLIKKPDYHHLLLDMTPMDKFGTIKLNRNNLKSVRNIMATLLRQAQQLLREKALSETFLILEATIHHLYRLSIKVPQFQEQLSTELRLALRLFDALCHQPMAPRLQQSAFVMAMEVSAREGYTFLKGTKPLLLSIEPFILEEKSRHAAFQLAEKKALVDSKQQLPWACMVMRWMRIWAEKSNSKPLKSTLQRLMPDILQELSRQGDYEDVVYSLQSIQPESYEKTIQRGMLQAGLRAARQTGDRNLSSKYAYELSLSFLDMDAWDMLLEVDHEHAQRVLRVVNEYYQAGSDAAADQLLLHGWSATGQKDELLVRLEAIGDMDLLMRYDDQLKSTHRNSLEEVYAKHIYATREAYGGVIARQKLSNIFGHLKSIDLSAGVAEKLKLMDKKKKGGEGQQGAEIRGFVFDLDGVIVDTAVHHFQSWKKILKELGAEITEEDDHHTRGASRMESLEYLLNRYHINLTQEEKEMWAAKKNEVYLEAIEQITPRDLLPGALAFLIDTRKAGLKLALGSASKNARGVLKKLGIEDRFDAILDGNDAKESKPNPEIFIKASEALGLDPAEVVVFEDAAKGVQAALAAGCHAVGLGDPDALKEADIVISGLDQTNPTHIIEQLS
jgi:beta-phosphoglucomutase